MKNKSFGFYLAVVAAILILVGLPFYKQSAYAISMVYTMSGICAAAVVCAAVTKGELSNFLAAAACVAAGAAVIYSFSTQLDAIGYVLSGLFTFSQIQGFVTYAAMAVVAWLLLIVASFTGVAKKN